MVEAVCVDPERISEVWPHVSDMIDRAYEASDEIMPDIETEIKNGLALLWVAWGDERQILCACITRLIRTRTALVCKIVACGGSGLNRWRGLTIKIEEYAKAEGCSQMLIDGRPGWRRVFSDYQQTSVTLRKAI